MSGFWCLQMTAVVFLFFDNDARTIVQVGAQGLADNAVASIRTNGCILGCTDVTSINSAELIASAEILAERLSTRGRESRGEVLTRLARSAELGLVVPDAVKIDNSGAPEEAGERLVAILHKAIALSDVAGTV